MLFNRNGSHFYIMLSVFLLLVITLLSYKGIKDKIKDKMVSKPLSLKRETVESGSQFMPVILQVSLDIIGTVALLSNCIGGTGNRYLIKANNMYQGLAYQINQ